MAVATHASRRTPLLAGGVLLVALLAAGCGAEPETDASADGKRSDKPSAEPTARASTREPSRTPTTSAPPSPQPTASASDGTRYSACADGTCEVAVSGPVDIPVDGGTFTVKKVHREDGVKYEVSMATGATGSGTMKGACGSVFTFYAGGGVSVVSCGASTKPTPPAPEPGALKLQLAGWDADGAAVIRFVSG